jgi:hypothetical protein
VTHPFHPFVRQEFEFIMRRRNRRLDRVYCERYQRTERRLGRQRGPRVAHIDLSRKLTEAT